MKENVERLGATAIMVEDEWGKTIDLDKVEDALKANPDTKILAFVHAETSTGGSAKRAYHHTAPVNALYALHESLVVLNNEGLENAWARHQKNHLALRAGLEATLSGMGAKINKGVALDAAQNILAE